VDCNVVDRVVGFVSALQHLRRSDISQLDFTGLLEAAVGAVLIPINDTYATRFDELDAELDARLSFPWVLPQQIPRRRAVFVHKNKGIWADEPLVHAIPGFGIDLVVLGPEGHWYSQEANRHLCESFIAIDTSDNDGLPERIVETIKNYGKHVDGIFTFNEALHIHVATASAMLGLPTSPRDAYATCADKFKTRQLLDVQSSTFQSLAFPSTESLEHFLVRSTQEQPLRYPVIVKPSKGTSSEGVYIAYSSSELLAHCSTAHTIAQRRGKDTGVVVETYVDGPEFDANFVLCDGEVLFWELLDDYPSDGDVSAFRSGQGKKTVVGDGGFMEIGMITPSALPASEVEMIGKYCHQAILKAGYTWGVFHVEGRVRDSSMQFREVQGQGWELFSRERCKLDEQNIRPTCFVLEINPRAPGLVESLLSIRAYGQFCLFKSRSLQLMGEFQVLTTLVFKS
jgi:hypothetical protein